MNHAAQGPTQGPILQRFGWIIRWISVLLLVIGLLLLARSLPVEAGLRAIMGHVERLGIWGPIAWGLLYVVATVLLLPASPFTILSGVLFGPIWGTVTVSLASTTTAAIAFLIARYLARDKVETLARGNPKFHAIDRAISQGGWRIVALLRLSPAMPFNIGNYLFGLTGIRFWPYVLASWICMLPGSFLFIYIGYLGQPGNRTTGEWIMLGVGLLATLAVTVYVTRLAAAAIRSETEIADAPEEPSEAKKDSAVQDDESVTGVWKTVVLAVAAVVVLTAAIFAHYNRVNLRSLFGPPAVELAEAYEEQQGESFDHSAFDALLARHVDADGWVDYAGLQQDAEQLDEYIASLADAPFDDMGRDDKLALLINAYNAFTLRLILDHYPLDSIRDIPAAQRWKDQRWQVAGRTWSLDQIEHEQIRPKFREPRIHFALVCAAVGCPPLRPEAYVGGRIHEQLEQQTQYAHRHPRWLVFDDASSTVHLTQLYNWYGSDFQQTAGSVLAFAARYSPPLAEALAEGRDVRVAWLDYDWSLNDKAKAGRRESEP